MDGLMALEVAPKIDPVLPPDVARLVEPNEPLPDPKRPVEPLVEVVGWKRPEPDGGAGLGVLKSELNGFVLPAEESLPPSFFDLSSPSC